MATSVPNSFTANTKIQSAQVNANFTAILALIPITTLGDLCYASSSTAVSRLAGNITTTKKFLTQTGDGANSAAPAWGTLVSSDVAASGAAAGKYLQTDATANIWVTAPGDELRNLGMTATVAANALTIALKQADASTDPASGSGAVQVGFRSSTTATGLYNVRLATAATSLVVSSGSTLGHASAVASYAYVYLIDNSGTLELAISGTRYNDGSIVTTVAEGGAGAADSGSTIYSTTARTGVPIRLVGRILSTQATAGTWASAITEISLVPFDQRAIGARYTNASATSINNNAYTTCTLGTKVHDTDNCFGSNIYTVKRAGLYYVGGKVAFSSGGSWTSAKQAVLKVVKNGSTTVGYLSEEGQQATHSNYVSVGGSLTAVFAVGDTIELQVYQNSGAALTQNADAFSNYMDVMWMGLA